MIKAMKKLSALFVVAIAAMTISCAGNANKPAAVEAEATEVVAVEADTCCKASCDAACDTTAVAVEEVVATPAE